ncbi:hypothetical protein P3T76_007563 [Phytophthora citrophthora]|uniref:Uncharacterized protein n=1 Tax=Phytophthora citrophthora TaxID=4793 RepID=A0AAD9GLW7_9STRA|nr:hypothetical protein P3T76_007563 [Phytophthora citrophthora]
MNSRAVALPVTECSISIPPVRALHHQVAANACVQFQDVTDSSYSWHEKHRRTDKSTDLPTGFCAAVMV